jgi:hypothetical protein
MAEEKKVNENFVDDFKATQGMNKLYLSGPMSNVENFNHALFNKVAAEFRHVGFEVCSPSEFFDGDTTRDRSEYMREAFKYLLEADTVVILPGWEDSKGARIEIMVAQELGLNLVEYVEPEDGEEQKIYPGTLTPVDEDGNFGSLTPVEETAPQETDK